MFCCFFKTRIVLDYCKMFSVFSITFVLLLKPKLEVNTFLPFTLNTFLFFVAAFSYNLVPSFSRLLLTFLFSPFIASLTLFNVFFKLFFFFFSPFKNTFNFFCISVQHFLLFLFSDCVIICSVHEHFVVELFLVEFSSYSAV